ncbi:FkbM family methyltransferase [Yoonia sp. BS5-3]|uniref:FkbM family methyltransferase n=1 Tax=Yoonia phaeophyticola TaxID=3137369 RepID=A0ABZ2V689_9RHOB
MDATTDRNRWRVLRDMLRPERLTSIVDIGANPINPAPYDALLSENLACVYGFEPQPAAFQRLEENPHPNRVILPYAIGDGTRGTLHICEHSGFTSLLEPNPEMLEYLGQWKQYMEVIETATVDTKMLDDIDEIKHVDLVKIDIQGGELSVFKNAENVLKNAIAVFTEVAAIPLYKNQPLLHDQLQLLSQHDYCLHKFDFFKSKSLNSKFARFLRQKHHQNQLVDGDAILIRGLPKLEKLPEEELKHLAILADAIMKSYDLVLKILEIFYERGLIAQEQQILSYCDLLPMARTRHLRLERRRLDKGTT